MDDGPVNLNERRAKAAADAELWTALDMAKALVRKIESGEIAPARIIVEYLEGDEQNGFSHGFMCAGVTRDTHVSLIAIAHHRAMKTWEN